MAEMKMTEVVRPIQTNYPLCELLEKVSTVAYVIKDEAKKDSSANKLELKNTPLVLNWYELLLEFFILQHNFNCVIQKCIGNNWRIITAAGITVLSSWGTNRFGGSIYEGRL